MSNNSVEDASLPLGFDEFIAKYSTGSKSVMLLYKVYTDLYVRGEYSKIEIIDGASSGYGGYFFRCIVTASNATRILFPINFNDDIDLIWLKEVCMDAVSRSEEVYLCVVDAANVIYQLVTMELP